MSSKKKTEAEGPEELSTDWPTWYYGPGGEGKVFDGPDDVPKGWVDHPSKAPPLDPIDL